METVISNSWHSYPSVFNLGHRYIKDIFQDEVLIEEKIDGSQFSWGVFDNELKCKSKGAIINVEYPEKMFSKAVEWCKTNKDFFTVGWTYRGEYLSKPKHNVLAYERTPNNNIILFDINTGQEEYLDHETKKFEAERLGLETVPILKLGKIENPELLLQLLETKSVLGGQKIEGFVVKNYKRVTDDKKAMFGKYVSEAFKEIHGRDWQSNNPGPGGIIDLLIAKYKTPARWDKAIIHLKEQGKIDGSLKDIGICLKEVNQDILKECESEIKEDLFKWAWKNISRGVLSGFPEYYKERLLKESLNV